MAERNKTNRQLTHCFYGAGTEDAAWQDIVGDIEELNATLGVLVASLSVPDPSISAAVQRVQSALLGIGFWLSGADQAPGVGRVKGECLQSIGLLQELTNTPPRLAPLDGRLPASLALMAKSICERTQRRLEHLVDERQVTERRSALKEILDLLENLATCLTGLSHRWIKPSGTSHALH